MRSYMLLAGIILVNIVISVLLDEFLTTMGNEREVEASRAIELNEGGAIEVFPSPKSQLKKIFNSRVGQSSPPERSSSTKGKSGFFLTLHPNFEL